MSFLKLQKITINDFRASYLYSSGACRYLASHRRYFRRVPNFTIRVMCNYVTTGNHKKKHHCNIKIRFALDCTNLAIVPVTNIGEKTLSIKIERFVIEHSRSRVAGTGN